MGVRVADKLEGLCSCLRGSVRGQAASLEEFEEAGYGADSIQNHRLKLAEGPVTVPSLFRDLGAQGGVELGTLFCVGGRHPIGFPPAASGGVWQKASERIASVEADT